MTIKALLNDTMLTTASTTFNSYLVALFSQP